MPELPDIVVYQQALAARIVGRQLLRVKLHSPFLLRTALPPIGSAEGRLVVAVRRLGKRIVLELEQQHFLLLHLMIAGRLRWLVPGARLPGRITQAVFEFEPGLLVFTEAGHEKCASLHFVAGEEALAAHDPGGLEVLSAGADEFAARLRARNRTLKRALTDPHAFSGIGNAYSDEILHRARLSPFALSGSLDDAALARLHAATVGVLTEWSERLLREAGDRFPAKVTAFRPEMAVHGRYGQPCPDCGAPVQRILYAETETNYCARCQTGGKVLADRALSRLLKQSWPRSIDDKE